MTTNVRVPDAVMKEVRLVAASQGKTPGQVIGDAWDRYVRRHAKEWAKLYEAEAKRLRGLSE